MSYASVQALEGRTSLIIEDEKAQKRFELGVCMALYNWDTLSVVVANSWGGPESSDKRDWMVGTIVDLFEGSELDSEDIAERLINELSDEFDCELDPSDHAEVFQLGADIVTMYQECAQGNFAKVDDLYARWQNKKPVNLVLAKGDESEGEDEDDDDAMDEDEEDIEELVPSINKDQPIVDEDGFELVTRKRKTK